MTLNLPPMSPHPLAAKMAEAGLSQHALAARCGVDQATVSRLLAGRSRPSLRIVLATMAALDVERPEDLFDAATLTGRVRYWATPRRGTRPEAHRRAVVERVLDGGPLPGRA